MKKILFALTFGTLCFWIANVSSAQSGSAEDFLKSQPFSEGEIFYNVDSETNFKGITFNDSDPEGTVKCWRWYYRPVYRTYYWRPAYYRPYYFYHRYYCRPYHTHFVWTSLVSNNAAPTNSGVSDGNSNYGQNDNNVNNNNTNDGNDNNTNDGNTNNTTNNNNGNGAMLDSEPSQGSPLATKGLRKGDIITAVDGKPLKNLSDLNRVTANSNLTVRKGNTVKFAGNLLKNADNEYIKSFNNLQEVEMGRVLTKSEIRSGNYDMYKLYDSNQGPVFGIKAVGNNGNGVKVTEVVAGLPGQKAGFEIGDVILEINGKKITSEEDYSEAIDCSGTVARMQVLCGRTGNTINADVILNK